MRLVHPELFDVSVILEKYLAMYILTLFIYSKSRFMVSKAIAFSGAFSLLRTLRKGPGDEVRKILNS